MLTLLLVLCGVLRTVLIALGGQYFLPDELRFDRGLRFLSDGPTVGWLAAGAQLLSYPDHTLFGILTLPAAMAARIGGVQAAAPVLSLASVANVALVYVLARRAGADTAIALTAAFLMATATSMTYYARHLLPYDLSLSVVLLAMLVGLGPRTMARALATGALASTAFLTYNGYWSSAAAAMILPLVWRARRDSQLLWRVLFTGIGFAAPIALLLSLNLAWRGADVLGNVRAFTMSVTMGEAAEGWSLPWEYLWHTEHAISAVWALGCAALVSYAALGRRSRGLVWLATALGVYLLLALTSTGLGYFTVAARHARQVVPLVCLAAANGLWLLFTPRIMVLGGAFTLLQAAANIGPLLTMEYPASFEARLGPQGAARAWTVIGPADDGDPAQARYVLINIGVVWPVLGRREPPQGRIIARASQPLEFWPYQYEGYRPEERDLIRATDISMRLIDTQT
ncbi:MAG: hypothetical protein LC797_20840 [Chloroflexi bacterium]|nr:hypothetical protein [Chloroflexota bacterium]